MADSSSKQPLAREIRHGKNMMNLPAGGKNKGSENIDQFRCFSLVKSQALEVEIYSQSAQQFIVHVVKSKHWV